METPPAQYAHSNVELRSLISNRTGTTKVTSLCNCSEEDAHVKPDGQKEPSHDRHGLIATFVIQLACFLWLAPIVTLLIFNVTKYIIGASAWCPHRRCNPLPFDGDISKSMKTLERFDEQDHNLLGALQVVAKLLEIWFTLIAAALVSKLTFRLAKRKEGLSMELVTRPSGFADLPGTLDPLIRKAIPSTLNPKAVLPGIPGRLWKAMMSIFETNWKRKILRGWPIHVFIVFTVFLCVVCNFMGPAVAVLVLPTLRWVPTEAVGDRTFESMGAGESPQMITGGERDRYFSMYTQDCTEDDFNNLTFSCAADPHASKLDSWIGTYVAAGEYVDGLTQEWSVKFRVNQSSSVLAHGSVDDQQYTPVTWWTPCRQLLSSLDDDRTMVQLMSQGVGDEALDWWYGMSIERQVLDSPDTYVSYNNSLRLTLQRKGPVLGAVVQMHEDPDGTATWTTTIDEERSIRCFRDYDLSYVPFYGSYEDVSSKNYTKCVRVGSGWNELNRNLTFTIVGEHNYTTNVTGPDVEFSIFSSDKAQFFKNNKHPSWLPSECLKSGTVPATAYCDWERLFDTGPNEQLYNRTQNVLTTEMSIKQGNTNDSESLVSRLTVDFVASLGFTFYELDASLSTNPTSLATLQSLPDTSSIIHVDPAWMLAAWTVDNNGKLDPDRTATIEVLRTMTRFSTVAANEEDEDPTETYLRLSYISLLPITQALSMIDYQTTAHSNPKAAAAKGKRDPDSPHLTRNAKIYVWAYGINGRTSIFGVVVACLGIAIVLAQVVLGFVDRSKPPSLEQLLVAALEYVPRDGTNGIKVSKTHFVVKDKEAYKGRYVFEKPEAEV